MLPNNDIHSRARNDIAYNLRDINRRRSYGESQENLQDMMKAAIQDWQAYTPEDYKTLALINKTLTLFDSEDSKTESPSLKKTNSVALGFLGLDSQPKISTAEDPYGRTEVFFKQKEKFKTHLHAVSLIEKDPMLFFEELHKDLQFDPATLKDLLSLALDTLEKYQELKPFFKSISNQIPSEHLRIEIAKVAVAREPEYVSENIDKYGIQDEKARIEIAKIAAAHNPGSVCKNIAKYGIQDEKARIEIINIVSTSQVSYISSFIHEFKITDQMFLNDLSIREANKDPKEVYSNLYHYGIKDQAILDELAEIIFVKYPLKESCIPYKFFANLANLKSKCSMLILKRLTYGLRQQEAISPHEFADYGQFCFLLSIDVSEKNFLEDTSATFFERCITSLESRLPKSIKDLSPCQYTLKWRNKPIVYFLMQAFFEALAYPSYIENYQSLARTMPERPLSILPAKWMTESGISKSPSSIADSFRSLLPSNWGRAPEIKNPSSAITKFFKTFKGDLKHKDTGLMQIYFLATEALDECKGVLPARKLELLGDVCSGNNLREVMEGLGYIYSFSMRKQSQTLNDLDTKNLIPSAKEAFDRMLADDPYLSISDIPKFAALYAASFDYTRVPLALEIYKARLSTLQEESVKTAFNWFVRSVLLNTFSEERFRTDVNPHLKFIKESNSQLFETWKSLSFSAPIQTKTADSEKVLLINKDWEDLLLSGTEVPGTCQHINSIPQLNKCLLAYCMDGKNAILAIKKEDGKMLARSILRLLWDKWSQKPVLFLDTLYPKPCPLERKAAITDAAKECAKKLGCKLFARPDGHPAISRTTIQSFEGSCPYDYADSEVGGASPAPKGILEISNLRSIDLS